MINIEYVNRDPAEQEKAASNGVLKVTSDGCILQGLIMTPTGKRDEKHPLALFLHGFPGYEQNRDMMQALRRCGMVCAMFHYRGSWGSEGEYHLGNLMEDAKAVLNYLKENAEAYGIDTDRIYLISHSMGGFAAMNLLGNGIDVKGAVLMAPYDAILDYTEYRAKFTELRNEAIGVLNVSDISSFGKECEKNPGWRFTKLADTVDKKMPLLFVGAARDNCVVPEVFIEPVVKKLKELGSNPDYIVLDTTHSYDSMRIKLIEIVAEWIKKQED